MADNPYHDAEVRGLIRELYVAKRLPRWDTQTFSNDFYYRAWLKVMGLTETLEILYDRS